MNVQPITDIEILPVNYNREITTKRGDAQIMSLSALYANFIVATGHKSENTARAYARGVILFLQWLGKREGVELVTSTRKGRKIIWEVRGDTTILEGVDLAALDRFNLWLDAQGGAESTRSLRKTAVQSFFRIALRDKAISRDHGIDLNITPYKARQTKTHSTTGRRLSVNEVKALRATVDLRAKTDNKALRDKAIIDLMLFAGLRRDEVATLDVSDIKQDRGRWWLVVTGKGKKTRRIKVHDVLFASITDWLKVAGREIGNGNTGAIFYNLTKGGNSTQKILSGSVIGRLVAEYGHHAGLAPREAPRNDEGNPIRGIVLGPHDLRRTCARNAFDHGAALYQVQTMLGHSSPNTTIVYIGSLENDADTAIDFVHYT